MCDKICITNKQLGGLLMKTKTEIKNTNEEMRIQMTLKEYKKIYKAQIQANLDAGEDIENSQYSAGDYMIENHYEDWENYQGQMLWYGAWKTQNQIP